MALLGASTRVRSRDRQTNIPAMARALGRASPLTFLRASFSSRTCSRAAELSSMERVMPCGAG
jgi:hypothetical protein